MTARLRLGSRRRPWPNDMEVGPFGMCFIPDKAGIGLYSKKSIPFENVAPAVWDYASSDPYRERSFPFRSLFQGAGQFVQIGQVPGHRYMECLNVDWSLGIGPKGPFFHKITPVHSGPVAQFVEALHGGQLTLFALCGQYINRINSDVDEPDDDDDDAVESLDLGAGKKATQGVRFRGTGGGDIDALYVANTGDFVKQYDGAAWHDTANPAVAIDVRREELWYGHGNFVRKVEADPTNGADFAAPISIGDASANITWLTHVLDGLVIMKENGIYSLSVDLAAGQVLDTDLWPDIAIRRPDNGLGANVWLGNQLFTSFGNALWRITPQIAFSQVTNLDINPIPLAVNQSHDSIDFGRPIVTAGHNDWWNYTALYNAQTGKSYLGKYGAWIPPEMSGAAETSFVHAFNCAIKEWTGQVTAMKIWGKEGEPERLFVGFEDGHIEWCWLSQASRNPANESVKSGNGRCEFTMDFGYIRWPIFNAGFEADTKLLKGFDAFGAVVDSSNRIQQQYRNVGEANYTQLVDDFINPGERHDTAGAVMGQELDCRTVFKNESIYDTPLLEGMGLNFQIRPAETYEHNGVFDGHAAPSNKNGTVQLWNAEQVRAYIRDQMESVGSVQCLMPDETVQNLIFLEHGENLIDSNKSAGREWEMPFRAVQFESSIERGTFRRLKYWTFRQATKLRFKGLVRI